MFGKCLQMYFERLARSGREKMTPLDRTTVMREGDQSIQIGADLNVMFASQSNQLSRRKIEGLK